MSDYINRSDAIGELMEWSRVMRKRGREDAEAYEHAADLLYTIEDTVVECIECSNWDTSWDPEKIIDGSAHFCTVLGIITDVDFYCAKGERVVGESDE